jgi:uncharacterized protein YjbI with pentapeptide repeats
VSDDTGVKFEQAHYALLMESAKKRDFAEWNELREDENGLPVALLDGADLREVCLEGAYLRRSYLNGADLRGANLRNADLAGAHLRNANLRRASLQSAFLYGADLKGADISFADMEGAIFTKALMENSDVIGAKLQYAKLDNANLRGAHFSSCNLIGATFKASIVDGGTYFDGCTIDRQTNFTMVGLSLIRINPELKDELEGNVRQIRWEAWYRKRRLTRWPANVFWLLSDYGRSTSRVVLSFFAAAIMFAVIYFACGIIDFALNPKNTDPGIIANLFVVKDGHIVDGALVFARTLYFSIVTMTTLGFGDIFPKAHSYAGHILLIFHVLTGYVQLGLLITRIGVLFTS